jgi:LysR family glycine cleavage system transcriptional activator
MNALRSFEAAGRHLSLSRAAQELHLTPAAVSHQVRALEDHLGQKLFRRMGRGLVLTDAGQLLLTPLGEGLDRMAEGVARLAERAGARPLTISVPPSFGAKWLVPRLEDFRSLCPEVEVRIDASMRLVDLDREDIDLAVRYGAGRYPGVEVECLMPEQVFPVCAPQLLEAGPPLLSPGDLAAHTLIHTEYVGGPSAYPDWAMWLRAVGLPQLRPKRELRISLASMAVDAAVSAQGVLLVGSVLVARDLALGRLVRLFDTAMPVSFCYYLVRSRRRPVTPQHQAFMDWLRREARQPGPRPANGPEQEGGAGGT